MNGYFGTKEILVIDLKKGEITLEGPLWSRYKGRVHSREVPLIMHLKTSRWGLLAKMGWHIYKEDTASFHISRRDISCPDRARRSYRRPQEVKAIVKG